MSGFSLGPKASAAGYRLSGFNSIGSTNSEAMLAARAGDAGDRWFAALQQTQGRGRRGRAWSTPYGNLATSLLLIPDVDPTLAATLGFVAGVALNQGLKRILPGSSVRIGVDGADGTSMQQPVRIALKWPNDVLADGAKLAGILLEAEKLADGRTAVVIGFGVNIVAAPDGLPYPATSLIDQGLVLNAQDVFEALSESWVEIYDLWDQGRGIGAVLNHWRGHAAGIGAPVAVNRNGDIVRGIFEAIDDQGRLIVRADDDSRIAITAGDVHFGATASVVRAEA